MSDSYCAAVRSGRLHAVHTQYHDLEYGFPILTDDGLFERLILEINQAGLSWETILKKREGFKKAYANFNLERVAAFNDEDFARLMADAGISRNRLKIRAATDNAKRILEIRREHDSFLAWLELHHSLGLDAWRRLFKRLLFLRAAKLCASSWSARGFYLVRTIQIAHAMRRFWCSSQFGLERMRHKIQILRQFYKVTS